MKLELVEFKNILDLDEDLQLLVRIWRNDDSVKKYMYTDHNISEDEHKAWLKSLSTNSKNIVFIVFYEKEPIGLVSINSISNHHKTADWAFYIYPEELRGKGIGPVIEYKLIDYVFNTLKFEKLNCEVLEINESVIKLHKKFGFKEEGIRRKNIIKAEKRIDVHMLGILKEEWEENLPRLKKVLDRL